MRAGLSVLVVIGVVGVVGAIGLPGVGAAQPRPIAPAMATGVDAAPSLVPVMLAPMMEAAHVGHLLDMDFKHLLALAVGTAAGAAAAEALLPGELHLVGVLGGALLGEWWHRHGYFPFQRKSDRRRKRH